MKKISRDKKIEKIVKAKINAFNKKFLKEVENMIDSYVIDEDKKITNVD